MFLHKTPQEDEYKSGLQRSKLLLLADNKKKQNLCLSSLELPRATRPANNLPKEWDTCTKL